MNVMKMAFGLLPKKKSMMQRKCTESAKMKKQIQHDGMKEIRCSECGRIIEKGEFYHIIDDRILCEEDYLDTFLYQED